MDVVFYTPIDYVQQSRAIANSWQLAVFGTSDGPDAQLPTACRRDGVTVGYACFSVFTQETVDSSWAFIQATGAQIEQHLQGKQEFLAEHNFDA